MQKNFWPLGIALVTLTVVGMIVWTVMLALKNPIELENTYMDSYQSVDLNINEIERTQHHFFSLYDVHLSHIELMQNVENLTLSLIKKVDSSPVHGAKITLHLTRPHTVRDDISIGDAVEQDKGVYAISSIFFPKKGRWKLQATIVTSNARGYFEKELYVQ